VSFFTSREFFEKKPWQSWNFRAVYPLRCEYFTKQAQSLKKNPSTVERLLPKEDMIN
jgi:hypothetical protein